MDGKKREKRADMKNERRKRKKNINKKEYFAVVTTLVMTKNYATNYY